MTSGRVFWPVCAFFASAAAQAVFGGLTVALRAPIVIAFLLVFPGLALARLIRLDELATELAIGLGLSLAIDTAVAASLVYGGVWNPHAAFAVVLGVIVACAVADATFATLGRA